MTAAKKQQSPPDLISLMDPALSKIAKLIDEATLAKAQGKGVIVTADKISSERILDLVLNQQVNQVCQADSGALGSELDLSALMLGKPNLFFDFPLSSILAPARCSAAEEAVRTRLKLKFTKASEKEDALDKLRDLLIGCNKSETLIADAVLIGDEMFTNAVFNAPFVDPATGFNPGVDRSDWSISMSESKFGEIMVGYDEERLAIVCKDPYGSLDVRQFFVRIQECFRKGVSATMRMGVGGAGIGSYMVLNLASSLYVGVRRGSCTIVGVTLQWKWSGRRRSEGAKNLHYIVL